MSGVQQRRAEERREREEAGRERAEMAGLSAGLLASNVAEHTFMDKFGLDPSTAHNLAEPIGAVVDHSVQVLYKGASGVKDHFAPWAERAGKAIAERFRSAAEATAWSREREGVRQMSSDVEFVMYLQQHNHEREHEHGNTHDHSPNAPTQTEYHQRAEEQHDTHREQVLYSEQRHDHGH